MFEFQEKIVNISTHANLAVLARIIPFDVHASKFVTGHVELHSVVLLEKFQEMVEYFNSSIFYTKVVHNKAELDGMLFVVPKPQHGVSFVVALSNKVGSKEIIGKDARLRETVTAQANFQVHPTISIAPCEVVFKDEFVWDVGNLDFNMFRIGHGCVKVEVLEVNVVEASTFPE
jgi:hypothetical protein